MDISIYVDPEFKNLIPSLKNEEREKLEESIIQDGCRDPLVLWGNTLIDGHNRYEICQEHNIPFNTVQMEFDSRDDAKLWMMNNQLARRNISSFQRIEIVRQFEDIVKAKAKGRMLAGKADPVVNLPQAKARDELGEIAGVSGSTYDRAVEVMETAPEPVIEAARKNALSINAAYQVTKMEPEAQEEISERIEQGENPKEVVADVQKKPHVAFNSGNNEWYTPESIINTARQAMGSIDMDIASSDVAQQIVQAKEYYTAETNGLDKKLHGNLWLNPPYSADLIEKFIQKLVDERADYEQAIVLVNNATETEWFEKLISIASAVCFPRSRVRFYMPDGKSGAPLQGQALIYIGNNIDQFNNAFSGIGWRALHVCIRR